MLDFITSSQRDSLGIIRQAQDGVCQEYQVVIPLGRDRLCRIRKAKKAHLREAGTSAKGYGA
jgi:hypothetical protein